MEKKAGSIYTQEKNSAAIKSALTSTCMQAISSILVIVLLEKCKHYQEVQQLYKNQFTKQY